MRIRRKVIIVCENCNNQTEKDASEVERNKRLERKNFCSKKCLGESNSGNLPERKAEDAKRLNPANRKDKYTGYREHLRRARRRDSNCDLDLDYLVQVWDRQNGRCVYSGVQLVHPVYSEKSNPAITASLDRIESDKGYEKNNVQFVSIAMNHMKSTMKHEEVLKLIQIIRQNPD